MVLRVDRSIDARKKRMPDVFLSHSSRDKAIVRQLAEDLCYLQVDAFLDEWELQPGDSLSDVIGFALEKSRYVAVVLGNNFSDSRWARDKMNQALAREKRANGGIVLPLLCGNAEMPAFLENKVYLDLRENGYYPSLVRLAAMVHQVSRQRVEYALQLEHPETIGDCIHALRYCGVDPFVILDASDWQEIAAAGGEVDGDRIRFSLNRVLTHPNISPHLRDLMRKLRRKVRHRPDRW